MPLARTWMLDASRVGLWAGSWFWCWRASKFVGWRRKIAKKGGILMLLSTSPPCKICKSGATHSFPSHGEWVRLIRSGAISSVAQTWLCNWSHTSHAFLLGKYFTSVKNPTFCKIIAPLTKSLWHSATGGHLMWQLWRHKLASQTTLFMYWAHAIRDT